ncbi:unnamed protein product [Brassicogethes aeneus]|uniref:Uncharacterized protein n=1 Tax=Brassicogethes aeneus TaxID=1431903 RepID=A0A9P0AXY3_BRAAE|nr:unnamed protein product [Brassicogethes aeneus]
MSLWNTGSRIEKLVLPVFSEDELFLGNLESENGDYELINVSNNVLTETSMDVTNISGSDLKSEINHSKFIEKEVNRGKSEYLAFITYNKSINIQDSSNKKMERNEIESMEDDRNNNNDENENEQMEIIATKEMEENDTDPIILKNGIINIKKENEIKGKENEIEEQDFFSCKLSLDPDETVQIHTKKVKKEEEKNISFPKVKVLKSKNISFAKLGNEECELCEAYNIHNSEHTAESLRRLRDMLQLER